MKKSLWLTVVMIAAWIVQWTIILAQILLGVFIGLRFVVIIFPFILPDSPLVFTDCLIRISDNLTLGLGDYEIPYNDADLPETHVEERRPPSRLCQLALGTLVYSGIDIDIKGSSFATEHLTPLIAAVQIGDTNNVKILLDAGANPNFAVKQGLTPLMAAAAMNYLDIVTILLANGANVNT